MKGLTKIENFDKQERILKYIVGTFSKESEVILIRGSTAHKKAKLFSDFDIEVYTKNKLKKPYYEIALLKDKLVLISVYFYKYVNGKPTSRLQSNVKVLYGQFNDKLNPEFSKDKYNSEEKTKRECQLLLDFFLKYLRTKDKKYLNSIQKRVK
jgi:predicted nucleotidyltransferase